MKKVFFLLLILLLPLLVVAEPYEPGASHIWEKAVWGDIPGITYVRLNGVNSSPTTTWEPLWKEGTVYNTSNIPLTTAMSTPYCASSDANDTSAGTGARTIAVTGSNTSFQTFTETVTMNGQTSVNLATANVQFIYNIEVLTAGSGGLNAGIIQCGTGVNTAGDPAVSHAFLQSSSATAITGDGNQSQMFFYAVPAGSSLVCRNFTASTANATAANVSQFAIDAFTNNGLRKRHHISFGEAGGGNPGTSLQMIKFPEKTILIGLVSAGAAAATGLTAECLLIKNSWESSGQGVF